MKTLFLPLFSETEPSETVLLKQTPVVIHLAMLLFLTVLVPFTTFSEMFNPPTALKNLVIVTVSFLLFIVSILTRNLHTPWHSIYGVVSGFGFAATTTLALVFRDCVLSLPLLELLSLSLLFYSVIRLSARRAAVSYAIFLILLLGATTSSVATIVDAVLNPGESGSYPFSHPEHAASVYSASLAGAIALLFAHPRFGTLLRYSTVKLLPIIVTITILAIALVATRSQSAFIALSVGVILALAVKFPRKRILLLLLSLSAPILLLLSAFLFPSSFWNSLFGLRLSLFKDTLKLAFAHLPQGCSPSTFFAFFPPFASDFTLSHPYASDVIRSSESFYADAFASCGLLVLPLLAVGVLLLLRFYLNATEAQKTTTGLFASLYLPMLVTLFVLGFFDSSLSSLEVAYFAVLLLASTCGLTTLHTLPSIREEISSIRSAVKITLLVVAAYLFVAILCLLGFVHLKTAILTRHLDAAYSAKEARKVYLYADEIATFGQKEYQSVSALYKAASLALEEWNFPIAHFYLKTLLKTAPYFSATHYHLFRLYILTGNEKEGIEHLRLYLKTAVIPPRSWSFLAQLGEFLLSKNEVEFAAQVKERASRLHSSFKQNQK